MVQSDGHRILTKPYTLDRCGRLWSCGRLRSLDAPVLTDPYGGLALPHRVDAPTTMRYWLLCFGGDNTR
jgi:hypothetical protein